MKRRKSTYTVKDITTLEGIDAIRHRSGMYVGSVEEDGLHHITLEILSNAIDEYLSGFCDKIEVVVNARDIVTITDNGRGVPFGKAEDGSETMENIFTKLHTGAKFNSDGSSGYNSSGGLNGIGAKATNALSEMFEVTSTRDDQRAKMTFARGVRTDYVVDKVVGESSGTIIRFMPDKEIFKSGITLNQKRLVKQLKELSFLCRGLEITLVYKDSPTVKFKSEHGLVDYIKDITTNNVTSIFNTSVKEEQFSVEVAFVYSKNYVENVKLFTNNIPNISGTHLTGFRSAFTRTVNDLARSQGLLKARDPNISGEDLKEGLTVILSLYMPDPVFSGQTKEVLTSAEGRTVVEKLIATELRLWLTARPNELKAIVEKAVASKRAREAARRAREASRRGTKNVIASALQHKLSDCLTKNPEEAELFIVEGERKRPSPLTYGLVGVRLLSS